MYRQKKIPLRKCMGCSAQFPKNELMRVVRSPEGVFSVDVTGKKPGRGAYVCTDPQCLARLKKTGRLGKVFEEKVPEEIYEALAELAKTRSAAAGDSQGGG